MGLVYVVHVVDPSLAATLLVEVLVAVFAYKIVVGIVSKLFKGKD
jgi:hypothetical protein